MSAVAQPELSRFTPLEIASGVVAGSAADAGPLDVSGAATPLEAIERVVLPALEQTPCCVSFSGGRDSSLVLAVAASLARRTALPQPVPVTNVFPAAPQSHENEWQELVVRRLGLKEWVRLEHKDELDLVGPVAGAALRRHGLCFPFNAFFHVPLLEVANGGSLLTGVGGDESLGGVRRYQRVLALNARPRPSDVARIAALALPASARRALRRRRMQVPTPWLTEAATRALTAVIAEMNDRFFGSVDRYFVEVRRARYLDEFRRAQGLFAADAGVLSLNPLMEPSVLAAIARAVGTTAPVSRRDLLARLFPNMLPPELEARSTKAGFNEAFFERHSRAFTRQLVERDLDEALARAGLLEVVSPAGLTELWRDDDPHANSYLLLQALWLSEQKTHQRETPEGNIAGCRAQS